MFRLESVAVVKFVQRLTVRLRLGVKRSFREEVETGLDMARQVKLLLLQLIKKMGGSGISRMVKRLHLPQHFLYFFPLPHGQGAFLPTFCSFSFFG